MHLNDVQRGWLAGIIDGEGTIVLQRNGRNMEVGLIVAVQMTHELTIKTIQKLASTGKSGFRASSNNNHKGLWRWCARGREAVFVLELVKDCLITKKEQCKMALEFGMKCIVGSGNPRTDQQRNHSVTLMDQMKALNKRGPNGKDS